MSSRNPLPKKLEEDMKKVDRYKPEPFNIDNVLNTGVENALFDDVFGSVVKKSERKSGGGSESKSSDFTTILASKLADTEKENKALRTQLATSNMKITRLEENIDELKDVLKTQTSSENMEAIQHIRHDNTRLQRQLLEMEQFLADYGLNWVGYQECPDGGEEEGGTRSMKERQIQGEGEGEEEMMMHGFDIFKKRIDELNTLISEEPAKVITSSHGGGVKARFAHMTELVENIKLTMYKNGLMIKRGPFRPAGSDSFNSFTRDIMDGYFPSEFRESSPEGVLLVLTDKREEIFKDDTSTESSHRQDVMKSAQLLERLPKTVIKGGDIVSVRGDISSKITSGGEENTPNSESKTSSQSSETSKKIVSGKQVVHLSTRAKVAIQNNNDTGDEVITSIQVKWHNGTDVFILKMFGSDLVAHIKEAICDYYHDENQKNSPPEFNFRCAYPPRDLPDHLTLIEAKLVPSGTLHVKLI